MASAGPLAVPPMGTPASDRPAPPPLPRLSATARGPYSWAGIGSGAMTAASPSVRSERHRRYDARGALGVVTLLREEGGSEVTTTGAVANETLNGVQERLSRA
jgi:hypothetical protein